MLGMFRVGGSFNSMKCVYLHFIAP